MKKLVIVLVALITISAQAQKKAKKQGNNFTPEQIATLQTQKMTLGLDLDEKQQKEVHQLFKKHAESRKEKKKTDRKEMTSDQRFELKKSRLDNQIAHQNELKDILTQEQFKTWKAHKSKRSYKRFNKVQKKGKKKRKEQNNENND